MKTPMVEEYRKFFNKNRDAQIALIADDPMSNAIIICYENGSQVLLDDIPSYVALFEKLEKLHPKE